MYNFLKFVDWPEEKMASNGNQIIIGIIGQDPFGSAADILRDKKVEDRKVVIKHFDDFQQLKEAVEMDKAELTEKLKTLSKSSIIYRNHNGQIVIKPTDEFNELKSITDGAAREKKIEELKKRGFLLADPSKAEDIKTIIETIANGQMGALKKCHLLFICPSEKKTVNEIIDLVKNQGVLTVADTQEFLETGGIVNFVIEDNKVRFDINLTASEKAGLKIRSQLLRLAKKVIKDGSEVTGLSETTRKEAK
jgi:threonine dehydrogenase-like Zn-dependent dehydrogenase